MKIVILDDGVNEGWLKEDNIINLAIDENNKVIKREKYNMYKKSHGSICAAIIKKYAPDSEIISIKVLDDTCYGKCNKLLAALDWCLANHIKLIHMSIGSTQYTDFEPLRKKTAHLISHNSIIVAACHNAGKYTIPACLSGVIGVKAFDLNRGRKYSYNMFYLNDAEILASPYHNLEGECTPFANSYAAPYITAKVYGYLKGNNLSIAQVKYKLFMDSLLMENQQEVNINQTFAADFIDSACVIDFAGKFQSELCDYRIENIGINELEAVKLNKNVSVIIFPDKDMRYERLINFLEINKKYLIGVVVCGQVNEEFRKYLISQQDCLVWSSSSPNTLQQAYIEKLENTEIPIISIICKDRNMQLAFGKKIAKKFKDSNYGTMLLSDEVSSPVYGYTYITTGTIINNFVYQCINRMEPDIAIAVFNNEISINSDLQIYCTDPNKQIYDIYDGDIAVSLQADYHSIVDIVANYMS